MNPSPVRGGAKSVMRAKPVQHGCPALIIDIGPNGRISLLQAGGFRTATELATLNRKDAVRYEQLTNL